MAKASKSQVYEYESQLAINSAINSASSFQVYCGPEDLHVQATNSSDQQYAPLSSDLVFHRNLPTTVTCKFCHFLVRSKISNKCSSRTCCKRCVPFYCVPQIHKCPQCHETLVVIDRFSKSNKGIS